MHSAFLFAPLLAVTFLTGLHQLDPAPARAVAETSEPRQLEVRRAEDGMFYVDAQVGGAPLRLLVDTGASMTVLTSADARRLSLATAARRGARIETAGGRVGLVTATLNDFHIGPHRFAPVSAAVVDSGLLVSLIGQDVLSRFGLIRIEGDRLLLSSLEKPAAAADA